MTSLPYRFVFLSMDIMVTTILLCFFLCPGHTAAQISPEPPPLVRFTGSFLPVTEGKAAGHSSLNVSIKSVKWRMQIAKVEKLSGRSPSGTRLLEGLFPRQLHFTGPAELLNVLRDPQIEGQMIIIEGHLYVGDHMFLVTKITAGSSRKGDDP